MRLLIKAISDFPLFPLHVFQIHLVKIQEPTQQHTREQYTYEVSYSKVNIFFEIAELHRSRNSLKTMIVICHFSLWCQSRLYSKLYNLRKQEVKEVQKIVNDFNQKVSFFHYSIT